MCGDVGSRGLGDCSFFLCGVVCDWNVGRAWAGFELPRRGS